jgi:hypothetical protein
MLEQFFDFCGFYALARAIRSWNKSFSFELNRADKEQWEEAYRGEEYRSHELLQRENRLQNKRTELLSTSYKNGNCRLEYFDETLPGALPDELHAIDEQLLEVRRRYSFNQFEIRRLFSIAKDNSWVRGVVMSRQSQYSFIPGRDKPYIWLQKQRLCAASGGCCHWECGCCEQPLSLGPTSLLDPKNEEGGLYAHCTAECGCCIKRNGGCEPAAPSISQATESGDDRV